MRPVCRTLLLLGSLLTLTSCFNRLDTNALEREIEAEIESQSRRLSLSEVRCPRDVYRQAGAYFRCVGQLRPEGQFTINVTQRDNQGNVDWDVPSSGVILNLAKVEAKLQEDFAKQFSKRAVLDCGELYRLNQPGEQFECQLVGGVDLGQEEAVALLVRIDPDGNLNWYEVREPIAPIADNASASETQTSSNPAQGTASHQGADTPKERVAGTEKIKPPRIDP